MEKIRTHEEFFSRGTELERIEWENVIKKMVLGMHAKKLDFPGYCMACKKEVKFLIDTKCTAGENEVNLRERLLCPVCNLNNRMRLMVQLIEECVDPQYDDVYFVDGYSVKNGNIGNNSLYFIIAEKW